MDAEAVTDEQQRRLNACVAACRQMMAESMSRLEWDLEQEHKPEYRVWLLDQRERGRRILRELEGGEP